ncbi:splicing factor 3A subunit 3 [Tanacetum coccineum]
MGPILTLRGSTYSFGGYAFPGRRFPSTRNGTHYEYEHLLLKEVQFSGEEANGSYLDMHAFHNEYINSKLVSFIERAHPLQDVEGLFLKVAREFNEQWAKEKKGEATSIDLDCYTSVAELVKLGPEKLKEALHILGLKTGDNVEKKQGLTYEEMVVEREDDEDVVEFGSDDESLSKYNPLNLPMGWDGKPIPYWLSKLHGLDKVFKCEICGNNSYRGRRAYERHFKEFQHQYGIRQLGIPNNKNFNEIMSIEEARGLWENIKEKQGVKRWRPELEEEFEDQ